MGLVERVFPGELDGAVEGIDVVKESIQTAAVPSPNEKNVVNVSPSNPGSAWSCSEHTFFKVSHEEASKGGSHTCAHGSAVDLQIVFP